MKTLLLVSSPLANNKSASQPTTNNGTTYGPVPGARQAGLETFSLADQLHALTLRIEALEDAVVSRTVPIAQTVHNATQTQLAQARRIIELVAQHEDVPAVAIFAHGRGHCLVMARMLASWAIRRLTGLSWRELGRLLNHDRTSAYYHWKTVENMRSVDRRYFYSTNQLLKTLQTTLAQAQPASTLPPTPTHDA